MSSQSLKKNVINSLLTVPSLRISISELTRYQLEPYQKCDLIEIIEWLGKITLRSLVPSNTSFELNFREKKNIIRSWFNVIQETSSDLLTFS